MPNEIKDRSHYYIDYYTQRADLRKVRYYEQKLKQKRHQDMYAAYGGEQQYYKKKYQEFCQLKT
mgnify:CR=1 FL=1